MLGVAGVDQQNLETALLQDLEHRNPVDPGRLHGDRLDPALLEPVRQTMEIIGEGAERPDRLRGPIRSNRRDMHLRSYVDGGRPRMDGDIARDGTGLFVPVMPASPCVAKQREGLDCAGYQFPNRDHREASPLSSAQQSMDHVFLRDHPPPKICRPLPSAVRFYRGTVSLATGGPQAGEGFLKEMPELVQFHHNHALARLWLRA